MLPFLCWESSTMMFFTTNHFGGNCIGKAYPKDPKYCIELHPKLQNVCIKFVLYRNFQGCVSHLTPFCSVLFLQELVFFFPLFVDFMNTCVPQGSNGCIICLPPPPPKCVSHVTSDTHCLHVCL